MIENSTERNNSPDVSPQPQAVDLRSVYEPYLLAFFVSLVTFLAYLRTLKNDFVAWDDNRYIYENPHIRSLDTAFFRWAFGDFYSSNWHPLTWISHALDYAVWGLDPAGHHLTSIMLHAINAFLVVLLTRRLLEAVARENETTFPDQPAAAMASGVTGLLFGLHPIHVESVAWAAERKDLLCALFFLSSLLWYAQYVPARHRTGADGKVPLLFSNRPYLFSIVSFLLALLSKPMAVTLPVVLLVLDWYPFRRLNSRSAVKRAAAEKLPFFALSLASSIIAIAAQRSGGSIAPLEMCSFKTRMIVAAHSLVAYLRGIVWPTDLIPYYAYPKDASLSSLHYIVPIIIVVALSTGVVMGRKTKPVLLSVWLFYVVTLLPVLGIVQVGGQAMADRYAYIPGMALFLLLGTAMARFTRHVHPKHGRRLLYAAVCAIAPFLAYLTFVQIGVWKNTIALWSRVIDKAPYASAQPYNTRGQAFGALGQLDQAIRDYTMAIALEPSDSTPYHNRGTAFSDLGRYEQALADFDRAIFLEPDFFSAYYNRGLLFCKMNRWEQGRKDFDKAIELNPSDPKIYNNRGIVFDLQGSPLRAVADFTKAVELDPKHASAYFNRGNVYRNSGNTGLARKDFQQACGLGLQAACDALHAPS